MCGRYELKATAKELISHFRCFHVGQRDMPDNEEMHPTNPVLMLTANSDGYFGSKARWGLVGSFLNIEPDSPLINVRSEGLTSRPFYRKNLNGKRCLIPATAFFEWQRIEGGGKQKMRISHPKGKPLMFAGIYDQHHLAGATCAILTTDSNDSLSKVHSRMPVILDRDQCNFWLAHHEQFPIVDYEEIITSSSLTKLVCEPVKEAELSPQLSFVFA